MTCQEVQNKLAAHRTELEGLGISSLEVFGSVARNEGHDLSDIDLLVDFDHAVGLFHFARVRRELAEILGHPVDLVTRAALREEMRDDILKETVRAI